MATVSIPVMAQAPHRPLRRGADVLQALGVDYIDETEVLTPADEEHHVATRPELTKRRSSAARATWARPCAASPKARP